MKAKATLWLWALRDVGVLAVSGLLSAFAMLRLGWTAPAICTVVYAFLAIQVDGVQRAGFLPPVRGVSVSGTPGIPLAGQQDDGGRR